VSPAVDAVAFALPAGGVSDPVVTDTGAVIVKVLEKKDATAAAPTAAVESAPGAEPPPSKNTLKTELLNERRNRFYAAYMTKARERMKVTINRELIAQLVA
jgi:parvulin-like peptidyl-prolyl isomerase